MEKDRFQSQGLRKGVILSSVRKPDGRLQFYRLDRTAFSAASVDSTLKHPVEKMPKGVGSPVDRRNSNLGPNSFLEIAPAAMTGGLIFDANQGGES